MRLQYVTVKDLARELSCHRETILRLLRVGTIPGVKIGRYWRLDRRAVVLALSNTQRRSSSRQPSSERARVERQPQVHHRREAGTAALPSR